jgi:hypothetical protein
VGGSGGTFKKVIVERKVNINIGEEIKSLIYNL